jgi:RNA polymerase sigma-70 factor (ECF subfamily)
MAADSTEISEVEIIARCKRGDRSAFHMLVERYQRRAYGIAYGMLRNREDALDAAQDAFVKVFRNIESFKGDSSFYTWFYRIVVNVCIDRCRKQKRMRSVEYDDSYKRRDESAGVAPLVGNTRPMHPGAAFESDELGKVLNEALGKLSENHRTILLLREVEGMSYDDIADSMGCNIGTVMSRLHHARKNLQKTLKPYLEASGSVLSKRAGAGVRKSSYDGS